MSHAAPTLPHLLQRAAQGSEEALSALVCARKERVYRLATALRAGDLELPSEAAATTEEVTEESARAGGRSRGASSRGVSVEATALDQGAACAHESGRPVEAIASESVPARWPLVFELHRAVAALPRKYREVLVLADLEGLESGPVAWLLNLDEAETKARLRHARLLVRERLMAEEPPPNPA